MIISTHGGAIFKLIHYCMFIYLIRMSEMKSIDEHIQKDQSEIESAKAEGNLAKVRHLTEELKELEEYKDHHPDDKHDPNALELFCDANPDEPECLVYDD